MRNAPFDRRSSFVANDFIGGTKMFLLCLLFINWHVLIEEDSASYIISQCSDCWYDRFGYRFNNEELIASDAPLYKEIAIHAWTNRRDCNRIAPRITSTDGRPRPANSDRSFATCARQKIIMGPLTHYRRNNILFLTFFIINYILLSYLILFWLLT